MPVALFVDCPVVAVITEAWPLFVGWPVVAVITEAWPLFVVIVVVPRMLCCHPHPSFGFGSRPEMLRKLVYIITAIVDCVVGRVSPIIVIVVV